MLIYETAGVMEVPFQPVRLDFQHRQVVIEQADKGKWVKAGWFVAGFANENVDGTMVIGKYWRLQAQRFP
jgi:hypothetical protein